MTLETRARQATASARESVARLPMAKGGSPPSRRPNRALVAVIVSVLVGGAVLELRTRARDEGRIVAGGEPRGEVMLPLPSSLPTEGIAEPPVTPGPPPPAGMPIIAWGEVGGVGWQVRVSDWIPAVDMGPFCVEVTGEDGISVCEIDLPLGTSDRPFPLSQGVSVRTNRPVVFGRARSDVARVVVEFGDEGHHAEAALGPVGPEPTFQFYVAVLPDNASPGEAVALDAGGRELGRERIQQR